MTDKERLCIALFNDSWGYLENIWDASPELIFPRDDRMFQFTVKVYDNSTGNMIVCYCSLVWNGEADQRYAKILICIPKEMSEKVTVNNQLIATDMPTALTDGDVIHYVDGGIIKAFIFRFTANRASLPLLEDIYEPVKNSPIEKGRHGTVTRMKQKGPPGHIMAVKTIDLSKLTHDSYELSVMELLANGDHKNVCNYECFFYNVPMFTIDIVMPCMYGDLYMLLTERIISEREAKDILYQICDAMKYIHSMDVIHYDIKPKNILVSTDTSPVIKVADFGNAVITQKDIQPAFKDQCGTKPYMAPEIVTLPRLTNNLLPEFFDNWYLKPGSVIKLEANNRSALDFTKKLLRPDWKSKRLSLTNAFEHDWLSNEICFPWEGSANESDTESLDEGESPCQKTSHSSDCDIYEDSESTPPDNSNTNSNAANDDLFQDNWIYSVPMFAPDRFYFGENVGLGNLDALPNFEFDTSYSQAWQDWHGFGNGQ
ncbi:putative serine/threonine-protein kinase fhkD [Psilocybe cubensis]|uniref:Serine/threonine-protein kinase fhkD n=2 Tax=Psilocybe cubensis TaxID=181762 RepID=A0ACB8H205_PSICU|nr:putative serine/threonine-protein kinase fhkD [Psilocybe cubensis]KAH9481755.1 putative serine/threonine-protein kinase fhkD [Psilocybe cubensis]